ncbi:sensor histidine kinase [Croceicoccus sediminis]|uniref:sensor histidine kinase n=1 Tax=Croceicoccus sediminis TaxID=2571150 RepID=UPI001183D755|nr:HAMP domain-containing sensor histidine kinase [Croceicoccus sediminis]
MSGAEAITETAAVEPLVARSDAADRLVSADGPLAEMQIACGGEIPGLIAAPGLLELVRKSRGFGMKLGRPLVMRHSEGSLEGWAEVEPDGDGCAIRLSDWHQTTHPAGSGNGEATRLAVENLLAEGVVWLDEGQHVVAVESQVADLAPLVGKARSLRGQHWTSLFDFSGHDAGTPPIWQARSGMTVRIDGSAREWHLLLASANVGFQLLLRPVGEGEKPVDQTDLLPPNLLGDELAPAMRNPIARIIRQAEAIRDRLAGPLPAEYREYAHDMVNAGRHLGELADDLGDAEAIEHGTIAIQAEPVMVSEVADIVRRLLQVRADARSVRFEVSSDGAVAMADRKRVTQILLNIIGNAISYGPEGGKVAVDIARDGLNVVVSVTDEGESLSAEEFIRMFDKFERLGRSGDGGSGLGLYIALMLARAMGGDLEGSAGEGGGNRCTLTLPAV